MNVCQRRLTKTGGSERSTVLIEELAAAVGELGNGKPNLEVAQREFASGRGPTGEGGRGR